MTRHDEAMEAARRLIDWDKRTALVGDPANITVAGALVKDALTVARALLALTPPASGGRDAVLEAVEGVRFCPFDKGAPPNELEPDDPCPVCGDLGTFNIDKPSNCGSPAYAIRKLKSASPAAEQTQAPDTRGKANPSDAAGAGEVRDALMDSQYMAGAQAGWNAANADDPDAAWTALYQGRAGYLRPIAERRRAALTPGKGER